MRSLRNPWGRLPAGLFYGRLEAGPTLLKQFLIGVALFLAQVLPAAAADKPTADLFSDTLPTGAKVRIGTLRLRHGGVVRAVAFSRAGRFVASAGDDRLVSLWDEKTGREVVRCRGHLGVIHALALSADGRTLVSGGDDGVRIWDVSRPGEAAELRHLTMEGEVEAMAIEGNLLAAGTSRGVLFLWDLAKAKEVRELRQEGGVFVVTIAPGGAIVACSGDPHGLHLWDVRTGRMLRAFGEEVLSSAVYSQDGTFLVSGDFDNRVTLWDVRRGEAVRTWEAHDRISARRRNGTFGVAFSPDGKQIASAGADGSVRLWTAADGKEVQRFLGHTGHVRTVAFRGDGKGLASAGADGTVRLWNTASGKEVFPTADQPGPILALTVAPDGSSVAAIRPPYRLGVWDAATGRPRSLFARQPESAAAVAWSPDGRTLALGTPRGELDLWDISTGKNHATRREQPRPIDVLVWGPDGRRLASWGTDHHVDIWDAEKGDLEQHISLATTRPPALALGAASLELAAGGGGGPVRFWDAHTGLQRPVQVIDNATLLAVATPTRRRSVVTCCGDGAVTVWERTTGEVRRRIEGRTGATAGAVSSDQRFASLGNADGGIEVYRLADGRSVGKFLGHRGPVRALVFVDGPHLLVSGGADGTVLIWDTKGLPGDAPTVEAPRDLNTLWRRLGGDDTASAAAAIDILAAVPARSIPFIREKLRPIPQEKINQLIEQLDDDKFATREEATQQLALLGRIAVPALEKAVKERTSLELRRRADLLLGKLESDDEQARQAPVQVLRALEVLEVINSKESRELMESLARSPEESVARAAGEAAQRLAGGR